jgi:uncharacterized protein
MHTTTAEIGSELALAIRRAADPQLVVLFGSHARHEAREDSDIDLLIVADAQSWKSPTRRQEIGRLRRALPRVGHSIDVLLFTPSEVEQWRTARNHVIARALAEGLILYERP